MLSSEDFRENPGTLALAASWIVVFALILLVQWRHPAPAAPGPKFEPLAVSTATSHRFGDMTWREVREGQPWRLVTATFVHFGLIHLTLNTLGLINLGRLVEPWYRTGPFLAACLAIGGLGNLAGGALRQLAFAASPWLASKAVAWHWPAAVARFLEAGPAAPVSIHTGGGSTILLGLLALGAVVGWRSRTRIGAHLQKQMVILLALTAALGVAMSNLVDNYGHLGGAIVGAGIGLLDRPLVGLCRSRAFRVACWAAVAGSTFACLGPAIRDDRAELEHRARLDRIVARVQMAEATRAGLDRMFALYAGSVVRSEHFRDPSSGLDALAVGDLLSRGPAMALPSKVTPEQVWRDRFEMAQVLEQSGRTPRDLWGAPVAVDLGRLWTLARASIDTPPSFDQVYEFVVCWRSAARAVAADLAAQNARVFQIEADRKRGR